MQNAMGYRVSKTIQIVFWPLLFSFFIYTAQPHAMLLWIGDFLQVAIPALGAYLTLLKNDREGSKQFIYTAILTALVTHGLKFATSGTAIDIRPDGNPKSFPSGHTSFSFQGAFFLRGRYGRRWGCLGFGLATLAAYSRVHCQFHHGRDIFAGILIAWVVNRLIVSARQ
jgi:membrane-associated phospholipid phosphatase